MILTYFNAVGMPDPSLTETSTHGDFMVVVPDAATITSFSVSGTRGGVTLEGPSTYPTIAGGVVMVGLVDPTYPPK